MDKGKIWEEVPWNLKEAIGVLLIMFLSALAGSGLIHVCWPFLPLPQKYFLVEIFQFLGLILGGYLLIGKRYRVSGRSLGLGNPSISLFFVGLRVGLILFLTVALLGFFLQLFFPHQSLQPFAELLLKSRQPEEILLLFLLAAFLAPLLEELYFRGILFPALSKRWGAGLGIVLSSLIFALLHMDLARFLPLAVGGMGLAYVYWRTGNLWVAITAHATWNTTSMVLLCLARDLLPGIG